MRFQLQHLCETAVSRLPPKSKESKRNRLLLSFSLPPMIRGLNQLQVSIPTSDLQRLQAVCPSTRFFQLVCDHLRSVLTVDPDILQLTQFSADNVTMTCDGRVKFTSKRSFNDLLNAISSLLVEWRVCFVHNLFSNKHTNDHYCT